MWPESFFVYIVNLAKKYYNSRDITFFLGINTFWRALYNVLRVKTVDLRREK